MRSKTSSRAGDNNDTRLDSKVKIPAQQYYEKYMTMARESMAVGDRIAAEGFYQYAEHYLRLMNEFKPMVLEKDEIIVQDDMSQDDVYAADEDTILAARPVITMSQLEPESEDL
jgi:hypothetical protein